MHSLLLRVRRPLLLLVLPACFSVGSFAAQKPNKAELREQRREMANDAAGGKGAKREDAATVRTEKSNAVDAESRQLNRLREQMEVTDDTEWALIAERIKTIDELRRTLAPNPNGRVNLSSSDKAKPNTRAASAQPEQEALRAAVGDRMPDAEIKARLARAHDVYLKNESRLAKARAELRSILTIRQEAVAVMTGILTP